MQTSKILWLITARAGSKGLPDKNVKLLGGIPLLAYRIKTAFALTSAENVWLSTDSQSYAEIGKRWGATVPFLRPTDLSLDTTPSAAVILHAMEWAERMGRHYEAIGLLQPTSPFVSAKSLAEACTRFWQESGADCLVSVREVKCHSMYVQQEAQFLDKIYANIVRRGVLRRQDTEKEVTPSGGIFIAKWDAFKQYKSFYTPRTLAYCLSEVEGIDIDDPLDFEWAAFLLEKEYVKLQELFELAEKR